MHYSVAQNPTNTHKVFTESHSSTSVGEDTNNLNLAIDFSTNLLVVQQNAAGRDGDKAIVCFHSHT